MFKTNKNYKEASRSIFMSSMFWFANVAALVVTFFSVQPAFNATRGLIEHFTASQYGYEWVEPVMWFWWAAVAAILFFITRASLATLIVMGAFAIAVRFL